MSSLGRTMLDPSHLEILRLEPEDVVRATEFSCGTSDEDEDLNDFLRSDALRLQARNIVTTFVAYYGEVGAGVLIGYVSLLTDTIKLETREKKRLDLAHDDHPFMPALKVARLAVHAAFGRQFRGTGEALMRFGCERAFHVAELAGCRLITLDAYPKSVGFYEKLGFKRSRSKEYAAKEHPSMWLDLFGPEPPRWLSGAESLSSVPRVPDGGPSDE
jgi:ribosomal protein S18 acetylase RimI-like enzyme